jgi:phospholipase C
MREVGTPSKRLSAPPAEPTLLRITWLLTTMTSTIYGHVSVNAIPLHHYILAHAFYNQVVNSEFSMAYFKREDIPVQWAIADLCE